MADHIKHNFVVHFRRIFLRASLEVERLRSFVKPINWRLNGKAKYALTFGVIAIVLVSCFAFLSLENHTKATIAIQPQNNPIGPFATAHPLPSPTPKSKGSLLPNIGGIISQITQVIGFPSPIASPGPVESSPGMNDTVWKEVAANAWAFFQPGVGVDNVTGLPYAGGEGFTAFTDWDLGSYIQAIIDAEQIGLINATGSWGANDRLNMVLTFLENRPLNTTTNWPFWFYDATNGQGYLTTAEFASNSADIADTGALLVALNNIISYNPSFAHRVDNLVYNVYGNRSDYASLVPIIKTDGGSYSYYAYYYDSGFASFWPQQLGNVPSQIMTNINNAGTITIYNVTLPDLPLTCEPLLLSIFELNSTDSRSASLMKKAYQTQQAYYDTTGNFSAFSEGQSPDNGYVYEWIIAPNGSAWQITNTAQSYIKGMNPVIFSKAAFGMLALYNSTYARNMVIYLEQTLPSPTNGYYDGVDTAGIPVDANPGSNTNSLILDAALYYIHNNPNG